MAVPKRNDKKQRYNVHYHSQCTNDTTYPILQLDRYRRVFHGGGIDNSVYKEPPAHCELRHIEETRSVARKHVPSPSNVCYIYILKHQKSKPLYPVSFRLAWEIVEVE